MPRRYGCSVRNPTLLSEGRWEQRGRDANKGLDAEQGRAATASA